MSVRSTLAHSGGPSHFPVLWRLSPSACKKNNVCFYKRFAGNSSLLGAATLGWTMTYPEPVQAAKVAMQTGAMMKGW